MKTRRAIVTTAAQVAVTAPAVGLLLTASAKPAKASTVYSLVPGHTPGRPPGVDDPGNFGDDVDAANLQSNGNIFGNTNQDDVFVP